MHSGGAQWWRRRSQPAQSCIPVQGKAKPDGGMDERMTPEISPDTTYTSSPRRARRAVASHAGRRRS